MGVSLRIYLPYSDRYGLSLGIVPSIRRLPAITVFTQYAYLEKKALLKTQECGRGGRHHNHNHNHNYITANEQANIFRRHNLIVPTNQDKIIPEQKEQQSTSSSRILHQWLTQSHSDGR